MLAQLIGKEVHTNFCLIRLCQLHEVCMLVVLSMGLVEGQCVPKWSSPCHLHHISQNCNHPNAYITIHYVQVHVAC